MAMLRVTWPFSTTTDAKIILWMHPANERLHYNVAWSLIGWTHTQNEPLLMTAIVHNGIEIQEFIQTNDSAVVKQG